MKSVVYIINNLEGKQHADHDVNMYDVPDYSIKPKSRMEVSETDE